MPTITDGSYQTTKGIALIGKLLAQKGPLNITKATVGTGGVPDGMTPEQMTDLGEYAMDGMIAAIENPQNGEALVSVQVMSSGAGFYASELMLWADDPDEGEIAYTYLSIAEHPEWIRPGTDPVQKLATFNLIAIVSSVPLVSATIHPDAFARAKDLAALKAFKVQGESLYHLLNIGYIDGGGASGGQAQDAKPPTSVELRSERLNLTPYSFVPYKSAHSASRLVLFDGFAAIGGETLILT